MIDLVEPKACQTKIDPEYKVTLTMIEDNNSTDVEMVCIILLSHFVNVCIIRVLSFCYHFVSHIVFMVRKE